MAFVRKNLGAIGNPVGSGTNGMFTEFHYRTEDDATTDIIGSPYFECGQPANAQDDRAEGVIRVGDIIHCLCTDGAQDVIVVDEITGETAAYGSLQVAATSV